MTLSAVIRMNQGYLSSVPLGAIIAWHRDWLGGSGVVLPLPPGWVECNGQVLNDPESPFNGITLPNLNGEGRFLRGGAASGVRQDDQIQSHSHQDAGHRHTTGSITLPNASLFPGLGTLDQGMAGGQANAYTDLARASLGPPIAAGAGEPRVGTETRPINMSVVWIIKVKDEGGIGTPVQTIFQGGGGGGLAGVIAQLAKAVAVSGTGSPETPAAVQTRQQGMRSVPVQAGDSLLAGSVGMVLDAARILYAVVLEYLNLDTVDPVGNGVTVGDRGHINLTALLRPDGFLAIGQQVLKRKRELTALGDAATAEALQIGARILGSRINPAAADPIAQIAALADRPATARFVAFDSDSPSIVSYLGPAVRTELLSGLVVPLLGSERLDHEATQRIKSILMDFAADVWRRVADLVLLDPGAAPLGESQFLANYPNVPRVLEAVGQIVTGDGLVARLPGSVSIKAVWTDPGNTAAGEYGTTWLFCQDHSGSEGQGNKLLRISNEDVFNLWNGTGTQNLTATLTITCGATLALHDVHVSGGQLLMVIRDTPSSGQPTYQAVSILVASLASRRGTWQLNSGTPYIWTPQADVPVPALPPPPVIGRQGTQVPPLLVRGAPADPPGLVFPDGTGAGGMPSVTACTAVDGTPAMRSMLMQAVAGAAPADRALGFQLCRKGTPNTLMTAGILLLNAPGSGNSQQARFLFPSEVPQVASPATAQVPWYQAAELTELPVRFNLQDGDQRVAAVSGHRLALNIDIDDDMGILGLPILSLLLGNVPAPWQAGIDGRWAAVPNVDRSLSALNGQVYFTGPNDISLACYPNRDRIDVQGDLQVSTGGPGGFSVYTGEIPPALFASQCWVQSVTAAYDDKPVHEFPRRILPYEPDLVTLHPLRVQGRDYRLIVAASGNRFEFHVIAVA